MKILLDPGHGSNTPGKRSPDGRFLEYRFNRDIALDVQKNLPSQATTPLSSYLRTTTFPFAPVPSASTPGARNLASATSAWFPSTPTQPATGGSG